MNTETAVEQTERLTPAPRAGRTAPWPWLVLCVLLAAFLAARVFVWANGTVFTSYDTFSYAYRDDPAYDRGPLVSFTGHAPRLWGAPLLYAAFDGDTGRAFAQWLIGTVAWAVLALVLWWRLTTTPARVVAAAGVLGLGLTPQVTSWDLAILSESLSISLGVLALAMLLWWSDPRARYRTAILAALTGVALWWTFVRPDVRLLTAALAVGLGWIAWRDIRRSRHRPPAAGERGAGGRRAAPIAAATAVAILIGGIAWASLITPVVSRTFPGWSATGLTLSEETLMYRLRLQVLPDPKIKAVYRDDLGMPDCPAADRVAAGRSWAIVEFAGAYRSCPDLAAWGQRNAGSSGYRFALAAPGPYLRYTWSALPRNLAGTTITRTATPLPTPLQHAAFPPRRWVVPGILAGLAAACAAALLSGAWTRHRTLVATAVAAALTSMASVLAGMMYVVGVFGRYSIQEAIALRLSILILVVVALDAALRRRQERAAARSAGTG
jgi:hypothetical protein